MMTGQQELLKLSFHWTYRRSAFLGIPLGTVFKPRPWQSTCDPEQLHLCGHPVTEATHTSSARARAQTRQSAARFSGPIGGMISTQITSKAKLIENPRVGKVHVVEVWILKKVKRGRSTVWKNLHTHAHTHTKKKKNVMRAEIKSSSLLQKFTKVSLKRLDQSDSP